MLSQLSILSASCNSSPIFLCKIITLLPNGPQFLHQFLLGGRVTKESFCVFFLRLCDHPSLRSEPINYAPQPNPALCRVVGVRWGSAGRSPRLPCNAFAAFNAAGGVNGRPVQLLQRYYSGDPAPQAAALSSQAVALERCQLDLPPLPGSRHLGPDSLCWTPRCLRGSCSEPLGQLSCHVKRGYFVLAQHHVIPLGPKTLP